MEPIVEPYNMFAQQKQGNYPNAAQIQQQQQKRVAGQVQGATVQDFVAGKQAANSQAQGYGANTVVQTQPVATQPKNTATTGGIALNNGQRPQNNPITSMEDLATAMGYTSPKEEERLRKASVANQRIMAIGDALRHIGNIANTVNYAPSQQFNSPVELERQRYLQGKALRDKANLTYLTYQQQKAAQDAKQRQWQAEYGLKSQLNDAQIKNIEDKAAEMIRHNKSVEDVNKWKAEQTAAYQMANLEERTKTNKARTGIMQQNANTNRERLAWQKSRSGGGGGSSMGEYDVETIYDRDDEGRTKRVTKRRTVRSQNGQTTTTTQTSQPKKKALPGQTPAQPQKSAKKKLPGM